MKKVETETGKMITALRDGLHGLHLSRMALVAEARALRLAGRKAERDAVWSRVEELTAQIETTNRELAEHMLRLENEPHEFVEDCDCHQCAIKQRDMAIWMLAEWAAAIDRNGTGWDDWDEYYKDTAFRPGPLRQRLDKAIAEVNAQNA